MKLRHSKIVFAAAATLALATFSSSGVLAAADPLKDQNQDQQGINTALKVVDHVRQDMIDKDSAEEHHDIDEHERMLQGWFNFDIALVSVDITLSNSTDFDRAIVFVYNYTGVSSANNSIDFTYDIMQSDCETEFANFTTKNKALYFTEFVEDIDSNGQVTAYLGVNLSTIETSTLWTQVVSDQTTATLGFCGKWNIDVDGVRFNYHEVNVTATINLKESDGFSVSTLNVGLDRADAGAVNENTDVGFPVNVYLCDDSGVETSPQNFTQASPISLCVTLQTPIDGVYVASVNDFNYSATQVPDQIVTLIQDGNVLFTFTTQVDTSLDGIVRILFLAIADMFVNAPAGQTNDLVVTGNALIAFGEDTTRRRHRMLATTTEAADHNNMGHDGRRHRHMQSGGSELAPFQFTIENLVPTDDASSSSATGTAATGLFGFWGGITTLATLAGLASSFWLPA